MQVTNVFSGKQLRWIPDPPCEAACKKWVVDLYIVTHSLPYLLSYVNQLDS